MIFSSFRKLLRGSAAPASDAPARSARLEGEDFRVLAESTADVIFRIGPDQVADYVSPSSAKVFGWSPEEMIGLGPTSFVLPEDLPALVEMAQRMAAGAISDAVSTFRMRRKDGSVIWVESNAQMLRDPDTGAPGDMIVVMRDISDRKKLEEQLAAMASTDGLTGLANRRAFDAALARDWDSALGTDGQLSLVLLDVDHFKRFNDRYGHQVGDDCLRAIASALLAARFAAGATVARYGGEEIAIILPGHDADQACAIGEAARAAVEALRIAHHGNPEGGGLVTVSVGVATALARIGGTTRMPEALLQAADTALYKAKKLGRNRVELALLISQA